MSDSGRSTTHQAGWAVDKGGKRNNNEDSAAAVDIELINGDAVQSVGIYAVADGMGGHKAGEVASRTAVHTAVRQIIERITEANGTISEAYSQWLEGAVEVANQVVYGQHGESPLGMGTTLVMAVVVGNQTYIANVGDSRAYIITQDSIYQITEDHSLVQELIRMGAITEAEAENHPHRHVLSQALGTKSKIEVDTFTADLDMDNYLLLCSDGLTRELDDRTIFRIIRRAATPQEACDALVAAANAAGGNDNISVVLIQMQQPATA